MSSNNASSTIDSLARSVPFLRRYARALTGSQETGDRYAATALEALIAEKLAPEVADDPKIALFRAFHLVWSSAGSPVGETDTPLAARAQDLMAGLTPNSREALLLHAIEGFDAADVGRILMVEPAEAAECIEIARQEMQSSIRGKVMIIEDEAVIAMDIAAIVEDMGHRVIGIARTRASAVKLAANDRPDLILADIRLADNSSGIDAVNDILDQFGTLPVIFITAYPERFLTGTRSEPAFLITKPFTEEQVRSAVSQAMFFSSTETLVA